jgi:hypothetical protein
MKQLISFSFFLVLIVLFQNCSDIGELRLLGSSNNSSQSDSGNGTGYGGKLGQVYYHYVPDYRCENRSSAFSMIEYSQSEGKSVYYQSKESKCLSVPTIIPNPNLDLGSLQSRVIGYEEKIFEASATESDTSIPDKIVEIWCVDQWVNPTIEVLSIYDSKLKQAQTDFYFPSTPKRVELNPARSTSLQTVNLRSNFFDLVVDKTKLGLKSGTFQGQLKIFEKNESNQLLQCRLGGYLDARLWPAKIVNFDNYVQSEWSANDGLFYISSGMSGVASWAENSFYSFAPSNNTKKVIIGNVENAHGVKSFQFTQDRLKTLVKAQLQADTATQLYSQSLSDSSGPMLLNNKLTDIGQDVIDEINISPDSRYVYYMDGAQEQGGDIEAWLRVVDTKTGIINQINHNLPKSSDEAVRQFEVSYSLGKVVYATGFAYVDIWISDLFGGARRKLDLSSVLGVNSASGFGGTKYYLEWAIKQNRRWLMVADRYLVLAAIGTSTGFSSVVFAIDLQTEKIIFSKELQSATFLFEIKGLPAVGIENPASSTVSGLGVGYLNLKTADLRTAAGLVSDFSLSADSQEQKAAYDLGVAINTEPCAIVNEVNLSQIQIDAKTWLVINRSSSSGLAVFYLKSSGTDNCKLINKMSLSLEVIASLEKNKILKLSGPYFYTEILKAKISQDRQNIILAIQGRLYLVPLEHRPVVEIFTAINSTPRFDEVGFIDNTKVYFSGQLIKNFWNQIFIWDLPNP